ncbi:hypothetical protein [Amaricoccus sp.]|uniref:hypothetical protein n=1 Tax=Amaricoccus sp. TaxID=1872485 RepID=UPI001B72AF1F|nr:hypothetical protein [Amaricoccus sp.]MBP7002990.1 hypothetical protein [Amaricoccus sp.]
MTKRCFSDWIAGNLSREHHLKAAVTRLFSTGDALPFDAIARSFTEDLDRVVPDHVAHALQASGGIAFNRHRDGIAIRVPGRGEVSYKDAVRLGTVMIGLGLRLLVSGGPGAAR